MALTKIGSIGINTGIQFAGITTVSTLKVGSGVTLSSDGDIFATGVTTATTFVGALTGNVTGNISGGTVAGSTGTFTGDVDIADTIVHTGDTNTKIRFPAADTVTVETGGSERARIDANGRFSLGVGDSPGSYPTSTTARQVQAEFKGAIDTGNNKHDGSLALNCTNNNANLYIIRSQDNQTSGVALGNINFLGYDGTDYHVASQITGARDATGGNNDIPGRLTFLTTADGASSPTERLRIDSSGRLLLGTTTEGFATADNFTIADSGDCGMTIRAGTSGQSIIAMSDATSGTGEYAGYLSYYHNTDELHIGAVSKPIVKIHDEYFNIYANEGTTRMNFGFTDTNGGELSIYDDAGSQKIRIAGSTNTASFFNNGGSLVVGGTSLGASGSFGVESNGNFRSVLASGATGDTLIGAIYGVSNGFQTNIASGNVQTYQFYNGNIRTLMIDSDGLKFKGDSAAANALDDYEEGTWTPQTHDGTVSALDANYTKIGRQVTVVARLYNFSDNSTNDAIRIKNLPFAANVTNVAAGSVMYSYTSDANKTVIYLDSTHSGSLNFYGGMAGVFDQLRHNELNASGQTDMYIIATYFAAS